VRIKLDENLPARLAGQLGHLGHDADTVPDEGLTGAADARVWDAAQQEERFFITQDLDFSDLRRYVPGSHHGVLLVRLRDPGREALYLRVRSLFEEEQVEKWSGCFVVVTEHKIRIRRPGR
jgi:predicted nuclease of predicted toxin-antitoxin system